jgi:hydroxyethylthiazole kinase-like uncharacterized protein yjeF
MVRFVSVARPAAAVRAAHPEVVVTEIEPGDAPGMLRAGRVQAWVAGPGLGTDEAADRLLDALLATEVPLVLDADAITLLARRDTPVRDRRAPTVLTPHLGEFAGVQPQDAAADRLGHARAAAAEHGAVVLLKGSTTVIAAPDGRARVNPTGTGWLATAGSGDVLSGALGSLLAAGLAPLDAASVAAYLHGRAAGCAAPPVVAPDLLAAWPMAIRSVQAGGGGRPDHGGKDHTGQMVARVPGRVAFPR